ncbi:Hsp70 family protein [Paractinoplanes brasiliensis]|uniref:Molecular chaperone DnaK (HSP70) n=1 Tax=Paractinoplanes brasiliensis TaxID=52695 RepID=A0A4R6JP30_9ACTN|nr:Hsp70 family protein [Actinoplanes brasiliensis]TDO38019.1 molecular chaperone DnaK (HSP70) [Actinoplanes brasiliensis]GID31110.1 molecular chaperone DnaK [Actinoplanes brasiliensis]
MAIFGIDLGTTYSCIAQIDDTGRPVVIKNAIGEDSTPSVVFFETPENVVVGREAKNSARIYPDLVVSLIKRRMGEDHAELEFHGVVQTPVSISAFILQELARAAQQIGHVPVRDVVITVPAYFGVKEREATRAAGDVAGLNVLNVVPEPVAAALHYDAFGAAGGERTILVYDLGGGTFDTTVIKISDREVTVVCTDGDHHLGGADWDERIADLLLQRFLKDHPDSDAGDSDEFLQELAVAAEDVKRALSSLESRRQNMRWNGASSRLELSRQEFENATADLLERTHDITLRTVTTAREKGVERFDDVLLVGGSTRMPAVAGMLRSRFGFEPKLHDPDLAVAKGAALFALIESVRIALPGSAADGEATPAVLAEAAADLGIDVDSMKQLAGKRVTAVVPRAFGVKVLARDDTDADPDGFIVDHLLRANSPLPAEPPAQTYGTAYEGMVGITLEIWEQAGAAESARLTDNAKIGEGRIENLPPMPANSPVEVTFAMDEMGTLRVHAVERRTDKELLMELAISGLSQDSLDEARSAVAKYAVGA